MGYRIESSETGIQFVVEQEHYINPLNKIQMDTLRLFAKGLTYSMIGSKLHVSKYAIRDRMGSIMDTLGLQPREGGITRSGIELMHEVLRRNLLDPREILPEDYNQRTEPRKALTPSELYVLSRVLEGIPRDRIPKMSEPGSMLSGDTVKNHLKSIYQNLGVDNEIGAFGVVLNAYLGGINLLEDGVPGEQFGGYTPEPIALDEELPEEQPEHVILARERSDVEKFLQILVDGGVAVIAYPQSENVDPGLRRTTTPLQDVGNLVLFAAFYEKDTPRIMQLIQNQSRLVSMILSNVGNYISDRSVEPPFALAFGKSSLIVHVIKGIASLSEDQRLIVEKLITIPGITVPEKLRRFLPPSTRRVVDAG